MSMGRGEEKLTARSLFRKMIKSDYTVLLPLYPLPFQPPSPPKYPLSHCSSMCEERRKMVCTLKRQERLWKKKKKGRMERGDEGSDGGKEDWGNSTNGEIT